MTANERPSHPHLAASVLMIAVVLLLIAVAALGLR